MVKIISENILLLNTSNKKALKIYGKDFTDNLGRIKTEITEPKDRKLITLVNECQLGLFFGQLYKMACNYVHPSSLASTSRINPDFIKPFFAGTNAYYLL